MPEETYLYSRFALNLLRGGVTDLEESGAVKVALLSDSYAFNQHIHDNWGGIKSHEASGHNYYSGGVALEGVAVTQDDDEITVSCATVDALGRHALWGVEGQTGEVVSVIARYAVVYNAAPSGDENKKLIMFLDFGATREAYLSELGIEFHEEGMFKCTVATAI